MGSPEPITPFDERRIEQCPMGRSSLREIETSAERAAGILLPPKAAFSNLVVNPVAVLGPVLGPDYSVSILLVQRLMDGTMPGCPQLCFGIVDVRDVAGLHIRAMTHRAAKGEHSWPLLAILCRFLTSPGSSVGFGSPA